MDGLIVDSEPIQSFVFSTVIKEYGKTPIIGKNGLVHTVGRSGDAAYIEIMKKHEIQEELDVFRAKTRKILLSRINKKLIPTSGFLPLIKSLKRKRLKTALASSRLIDHVSIMLKSLGVEGFFDVIVGGSPSTKRKPEPDIFLEATKELKTHPKHCIVIEDSEMGVIAGKRAGMKVIAVPSKYTKSHDFSNADKVVDSLSKITSVFISEL